MKNKLLLTTALTSSLLGYYRRAYSACSGSSGTYTCSGTTTSTQTISANNAQVSATSDFNLTSSSGKGITISGDGAFSFSDNANSSITANNATGTRGVEIISNNDDGSTESDISVNVNGSLNLAGTNSTSSSVGISSQNLGSGTTTLEISGSIYANLWGIYSGGDGSMGNVSITTNSASVIDVNGNNSNMQSQGIAALNLGSGTTTLEIAGDIYARKKGIYAYGDASTSNISITTARTSYISSGDIGIEVNNGGTGSTTLNLSGDITATSGSAIYIKDSANSDANITIQNGATISGNKVISSKASNNVAFDVTLDGSSSAISITGTSGTAIEFDADASNNDSLTITGDVTISGNTNAGAGTDSLVLNNTNLTSSGYYGYFYNFESVTISGNNILTGNFNFYGLDITSSANSSLKVNGTFGASSLTLASGSTLSGNNTFVGNLIAGSGAIIAPGNSIGTINVTGNLNLNSGSILNIEIDKTGADKIVTTGNITIADGAMANISSINLASGSGTILQTTGGTLSGNFANNVTSTGSNVSTIYAPNSTSLAVINLNTAALNNQIQSSMNSSILFNDTLNDQIALNGFNQKERNFWVRNIHRNRKVSSNDSGLGFNNKSDGIALGFQQEISDDHILGFALSQIINKNSSSGNLGTRSDEANFAAIYSIYNKNLANNSKLFTSLSFGIGYHDNSDSRLVYNSGNAAYARSSSSDYEYNLNLQAGIKSPLKNNFFLMPRISASYIHNFAGSVKEDNGGTANISLNKFDFSTIKLRESVRFGKDDALKISQLNDLKISPYLELGLAQERAANSRKISGQFSNGAQFATKLGKNNRNFVTSAIGFIADINSDISSFLSVENSHNSEENRNEARVGVNIKF